MDIYKWAEQYDWLADYCDMQTGYIYGVVEYKRSLDAGVSLPGIPVYDDGVLIGYAKKK